MTADASAAPGADAEGVAVAASGSATPTQQLTFSREAIDERDLVLAKYAKLLDQASIVAALLPPRPADQVAKSHVQWAAGLIGVSRENARINRLRDIGLLLMGAGLGMLGALFLTWQFTVSSLASFMAPLLVGAVMYAYAWGRE